MQPGSTALGTTPPPPTCPRAALEAPWPGSARWSEAWARHDGPHAAAQGAGAPGAAATRALCQSVRSSSSTSRALRGGGGGRTVARQRWLRGPGGAAQELKEIARTKDTGIELEPDEANIYSWKALLQVQPRRACADEGRKAAVGNFHPSTSSLHRADQPAAGTC